MFKINDYVVYRRDVCLVKDIYRNKLNDMDYYVLAPIKDESLKIDIPADNRNGYLRSLMSKKEVEDLIKVIPSIPLIENNDKLIENEYKRLLNNFNHQDLVRIIKTTYLRNKERVDNKKKTSDRDSNYFKEAEKCLYDEIGTVLGLSFDETKRYILQKIGEQND